MDANRGPQDASAPLPEDKETWTVTAEEVKSLQKVLIMRQGGPISWGISREKCPIRSSCKVEIKAVDEGAKLIAHIHYLLEELDHPKVKTPMAIYNDNKHLRTKMSYGVK